MSFFKLRRTGVVVQSQGLNFTRHLPQPLESSLLYEIVAGAVYGAVGAGILAAFGFSALSIPAVAAWCACAGALSALFQDRLPLLAMGRWVSHESADSELRAAANVPVGFGLRVAIVFLGVLTTCFSLETAAAGALGAVVTEGIVEMVSAVDSFIAPSPSPSP